MAGSMKSADVPRGIAVSVALKKPGSTKNADVLHGIAVFVFLEEPGNTKKCGRPKRNRWFGEVEARKSVDVPSGIAVLERCKHEKVRTSQAESLFLWSCGSLRVEEWVS